MAVGLHMLTRAEVDAALDEFVRLGREPFLEKYGFGRARDYFVRDDKSNSWADSKAVVGAAYGYRFPQRGPLRASEFSDGIGLVVKLLRELGFEVRNQAEIEDDQADRTAWSSSEVELIAADYLSMLSLVGPAKSISVVQACASV